MPVVAVFKHAVQYTHRALTVASSNTVAIATASSLQDCML